MTMTVSSIGNIPSTRKTNSNEQKGKTIGTAVGAGTSIAYNVKHAKASFVDAIEEHVRNGKAVQARIIAGTIVAGFIAGATALGRFAGGLIGKAVDNK